MHDHAGETEPIEVEGRLCFNELESGFWSLELAAEHPVLGEHVVLSGFELPAGAEDGARVRMRVRPREDLVDFTMAGLRVEVESAQLLAP